MMKKRDTKKEDETKKIVKALLDLPVKSLEQQIELLEKELSLRKEILDDSLSNLGTEKLKLEEQIRRLRYSSLIGISGTKTALEKEREKIVLKKIDEQDSYFRDLIQLEEKLNETRENLKEEKIKRKLIK